MAEKLTNKERQIFELNAKGLFRTEIGARLSIERSTVQAHLNSITSKYGMPDGMNMQYFLACEYLKEITDKFNLEIQHTTEEIIRLHEENDRLTQLVKDLQESSKNGGGLGCTLSE